MIRIIIKISLLFLLLSVSSYSFAETESLTVTADSTAVTASTSTEGPTSAGSILNMVFGLFIVLLVIYGLSILIKKMGGIPGRTNNLIHVVSGINLSHRDKIVLVQVGKEQLLLGLSPGRINLLHTLDEPLDEKSVTYSQESKFAKKLSGLLHGESKE